MAWSYDSTDLSTDLNRVRWLVGDTDTTDQLVTNEEINYALTVNSNVFSAAVVVARSIQSKFTRLVDTSVESVSVKYSQRAKAYAALVEDLEAQARENDLVTPSVFGVSKDDIRDNRADPDRVDERFFQDQYTNPPADSIKIDGQDV